MTMVTEAASLDSLAGFASRAGGAPVHCGTPMEFVRQSLGKSNEFVVNYTFESGPRPVQLPPVWRCACGFQLDAQASRPVGSLAVGSASARPPMGLPSQ